MKLDLMKFDEDWGKLDLMKTASASRFAFDLVVHVPDRCAKLSSVAP